MRVKSLEIAIMALAAWGFWTADVPMLLARVFLMRLHSTLFWPVKFAYLPQHLKWQLTALIRKETLMNAGLALLTLFAGPYSVPMCALIQLVHPTATVPASSRPKKS